MATTPNFSYALFITSSIFSFAIPQISSNWLTRVPHV
jgi:hypothetical protein